MTPKNPLQFILLFVGFAIVLGAIYAAYRAGVFAKYGLGREFLCDSCKYNDARYCTRPDRPNAKSCPDYKSRV